MVRLFKTAQSLSEEDELVMKAIAEITTMMMRMEQSPINGGKDEIQWDKAIQRITKLHQEIKGVTEFKLMKIELKRWMQRLLTDLEVLVRRHHQKIYLEIHRQRLLR